MIFNYSILRFHVVYKINHIIVTRSNDFARIRSSKYILKPADFSTASLLFSYPLSSSNPFGLA